MEEAGRAGVDHISYPFQHEHNYGRGGVHNYDE